MTALHGIAWLPVILGCVLGCATEEQLEKAAPATSQQPEPPREVPSIPSSQPASPTRVRDPLVPTKWLHPTQGQLALESDKQWYLRKPPRELQYSRSREERGGVLPCEAPDPGFGVHGTWQHTRPIGMFIAPREDAVDAQGYFDLFVHFHAQRPARKEFVRSGVDHVFMGVSLGIGVPYGPDFEQAVLFEKMIATLEKKLGHAAGRPAHLRRLALSSWSSGFEAIAKILRQPLGSKVDALFLIDSFHGPGEPNQRQLKLEPFVEFAERALRGERFFYASHSAIPTRGYASTTETIHWLLWKVGGRPAPATRKDALGLELRDWFSRGSLHTRGYAGDGKLDHCAQFGVYADVVQAIDRRWRAQLRPDAG